MTAPLVLRAFLILAVLGTVASKLHAASTPSFDINGAVVNVLARKGLAAHRRPPYPGSGIRGHVSFRMAGCAGPIHVIPVSLNLQELPFVPQIADAGYAGRFAYLDRTWQRPDQVGMRLEWLRHKAFSMLGLSQYQTPPKALLIAEPAGCNALGTIDWRPVWRSKS